MRILKVFLTIAVLLLTQPAFSLNCIEYLEANLVEINRDFIRLSSERRELNIFKWNRKKTIKSQLNLLTQAATNLSQTIDIIKKAKISNGQFEKQKLNSIQSKQSFIYSPYQEDLYKTYFKGPILKYFGGQNGPFSLSTFSEAYQRINSLISDISQRDNSCDDWAPHYFKRLMENVADLHLQKPLFEFHEECTFKLKNTNLTLLTRDIGKIEKVANMGEIRGRAEMLDRRFEDGVESCPICLEKFKDDDVIKQTACGHLYCQICFNQAISKSSTCSVCRKDCTHNNLNFLLNNVDR